jgi:hypothetical protein
MDSNPLGLIYALNFGTSFNLFQNISNVFATEPTRNSSGSIIPSYASGAMFANDY